MRRRRRWARRELLGYAPLVLLGLVVMAVTALTVAFGLGGG